MNLNYKGDYQFDTSYNLMNIKGGSLVFTKQYEIWVSTIYLNVKYSQKVIINRLNFDLVPVVSIE